jgi:hypothetical protein
MSRNIPYLKKRVILRFSAAMKRLSRLLKAFQFIWLFLNTMRYNSSFDRQPQNAAQILPALEPATILG